MKVTAALTFFIVGLVSLIDARCLAAPESGQKQKWVASWTTAISGRVRKTDFAKLGYSQETIAILKQLPEFGLTDFDALTAAGEASDQSFRMIVKPDLWGDTVRLRFSNVFGDRDISLTAAAVGLQESGGNVVHGTAVRLTFGGTPGVVIPRGGEVLSDPAHLAFVTKSKPWLAGRALAVSFAIKGTSGILSIHGAPVSSYIARPGSGDHTRDADGSAFPHVTHSFFLVKELDVLADPETAVVCAVGDSITDGGTTLDGYDGWSDDLSIRAHKIYGDKVSVVNMGIGGNTVVTLIDGGSSDPLVKRLDRDVLSIAGLTSVVLLEGINDLGRGQSKPEPVIQGYRQVVARLHARGIAVIGATVTSSLRPEAYDDGTPPTLRAMSDQFGSMQTNSYRKELDQFILTSGLFDAVADMEKATEDPATGALYKRFQGGDYLHPNRAGHQAMADAVDLSAIVPPRGK